MKKAIKELEDFIFYRRSGLEFMANVVKALESFVDYEDDNLNNLEVILMKLEENKNED